MTNTILERPSQTDSSPSQRRTATLTGFDDDQRPVSASCSVLPGRYLLFANVDGTSARFSDAANGGSQDVLRQNAKPPYTLTSSGDSYYIETWRVNGSGGWMDIDIH